MKKLFLCSLALTIATFAQAGLRKGTYSIDSPSGRLSLSVDTDNGVRYSLKAGSNPLIVDSPVSVTFIDGTVFGGTDMKVRKSVTRHVSDSINAVNYRKAVISDVYTEFVLAMKGYDIQFRLYDDGMAWRFVSYKPGKSYVAGEQACFNFADDWNMYVPYVCQNTNTLESQRFNSFENVYARQRISEWNRERLAFAPLMVEGPDGIKMVVTESDLLDYPGMMLYAGPDGPSVGGSFAKYPKELRQGGHNELQLLVSSREEYIACVDGPRSFPWRVVAVSFEDKDMADNDMVYRLASPKVDMDFSWVKPGKVAWDWWNKWNIFGVDFKSGINNDTYKYYIDFAASKGIEYVILDEGWAVNKKADLFQVVPEIDLNMLVDYASSKGVGLILWAGYLAFDRDMERVCRHYSEMGVKGFKIDFMDRDDQIVESFLQRAAETAARYHLVLDFHGIHKPTGLARKYPNVLNYEGVFGLEQMKWSKEDVDMVTFDVTIPFIRLVAGPADYTQGAMRNAIRSHYRPVDGEPMSQGTRCHQLAEYIVFDSPINMLCDSPSNYMCESECADFISAIPTVWDETVALDGKVAEYAATMRRSGEEWYLGAITGWDGRDMTFDLTSLGPGEWTAEMFRDGVNADKVARDYKKETVILGTSRTLTVHLAPGGGVAMRFRRCTASR